MAERYVKLTNEIRRRADLTAAAKLVYADLVDRMGKKGVCWPGLRRLAADNGVTKSTAQAAIASLEAAGLIVIERTAGGRSNRYRVPSPADMPLFGGQKVAQAADDDAPEVSQKSARPFSGPVLKIGPGGLISGTQAGRKLGHNLLKTSQEPNPSKGPANSPALPSGKGKRKEKAPPIDPAQTAREILADRPAWAHLADPAFFAAWDPFAAMRARIRKPLTADAVELILAKLAGHPLAVAVAALAESTIADYPNVYPEKHTAQGPERKAVNYDRF